MRTTSWTSTRDTFVSDIEEGHLQPDGKTPTEPKIIKRYRVRRHSVRLIISDLARRGKLSVEQRLGMFVSKQRMLHYTLGKRTRLRRDLCTQGVGASADGTLISFSEVIWAASRFKFSILSDNDD